MSTVTKTHKNKEGKLVKIVYNTEPTFEPTKISEICMEFIEAYCVANKELDWLLKTINQPYSYTYKKGEKAGQTATVDYPFINIRKDFAAKFFPNIIKGEEKTESIKERLNRLYGKK